MDVKTDFLEPKTLKQIENILITQARPEGEKSPYFEMARKFNLNLTFEAFIRVQPISAKEFRKQKIDICLLYTSPSPRDGLLSRMPSSA